MGLSEVSNVPSSAEDSAEKLIWISRMFIFAVEYYIRAVKLPSHRCIYKVASRPKGFMKKYYSTHESLIFLNFLYKTRENILSFFTPKIDSEQCNGNLHVCCFINGNLPVCCSIA